MWYLSLSDLFPLGILTIFKCTVRWLITFIMKNSMMIAQKIKNRITIWSNNTTSRYTPTRIESKVFRNICTTTYTIAWFTSQKKCDTYNGILLSFKKENDSDISCNMDELWGYHTKWNTTVTKRYVWFYLYEVLKWGVTV